MSDRIDELPRTSEKPSILDTKIMNDLFNDSTKKTNWKSILLLSLLFIVLSLPVVDKFLKNISDSELVILLAKTTVFVVILTLLN